MSYYICEDLIVEIFIRLPPESLLRFRSISKSLCSFIDSPNFILLHMLQSPQNVLSIHNTRPSDDSGRFRNKYFYTFHSPEKLPLCPRKGYVGITPVEFPLNIFHILGSCNGILFMLYDEPPHFQTRICLWNPSIRRKVNLPDHPVWRYEIGGCGDTIGFGFDPKTNDYKIVTISYKYERNSLVYTMKTGTWSKIASPTTPFSHAEPGGSFVNGVFHWVVIRYINGTHHHYIMTFDLSTHVFGTIELPEPSWKTIQVIIINSSLAVISREGDNTWIWVRREQNNIPSWSVHFKLEKNEVVITGKALHITATGNLLFYSFSLDGLEGFQVYNPETRKGSRVVDIGASSYIDSMEMHVESLELLDIGTICEGNQPSFGTTCEGNQPSFGTNCEGNQPSFLEGKKRNRTTLRKLFDFCTLCSTPA